MKEERFIVQEKDGEVLTTIGTGDRILRKKSVEYLKTVQTWKIEKFYKGHIGEIEKWMSDLSMAEKAFLFSIVPYISYVDCHLEYHNGNDMGTEDLVKISYMARRTVYDAIRALVKKDILYKGKNSAGRQYFINPWLFCKGSRINKVLQTMFKNYHIRILNGVRWKDVGDTEYLD